MLDFQIVYMCAIVDNPAKITFMHIIIFICVIILIWKLSAKGQKHFHGSWNGQPNCVSEWL